MLFRSQRIDNYSGMTYTYSETASTKTETIEQASTPVLSIIAQWSSDGLEKQLYYVYPDDHSDSYIQETDDFGRMTELVTPLGTYTYTYDGLGRVTAKTLKSGSVTVAKETYLYNDSNDSGYTSPLKNRITYKDNSWVGYICEGNGLIRYIIPGTNLCGYRYDGIDRKSVV